VADETTFSDQPVQAKAATGASSTNNPSNPAGDAQQCADGAAKCSFFRKKRHMATLGLLVLIVGAALWMTYGGVFSRPKGAQAGTGTDAAAPSDAAPATQPAKGQVTVTKTASKVLTLGGDQPATRPAAKAAPTGASTNAGDVRADKKPPTKLTLGSGAGDNKGGFKQSPKPASRPAQ
jgi:hypothetical protein